jgi:phage gp46-like protein
MDVALTFTRGTFLADISLDGSDLRTDSDLETALTLSLFCDRRADNDDPLEKNESKRGWWGDTFAEIRDDKFGSKLWLLRREKQLQVVLERAREYAEEATAWLIEDGVASAVTVETEIYGEKPSGILAIKVEVTRPTGVSSFQFDYAWKQI